MEEPRGVIRFQKSNFLEVVKKRVKSQHMNLGKACFSVEDSRTMEELGHEKHMENSAVSRKKRNGTR